MNEGSSPIAVIRARLPYITRGALSRAWFEALQVATPPGRGVALSPARSALAGQPANAGVRRPAADVEPKRLGVRANPGRPARAPSSPFVGADARGRLERRHSRTVALAARAPRGRAASSQLTLTVEGARVHLLVRRCGDRIDVVALCSARRVEAVRRALARIELELHHAGSRTAVCVTPLAFA